MSDKPYAQSHVGSNLIKYVTKTLLLLLLTAISSICFGQKPSIVPEPLLESPPIPRRVKFKSPNKPPKLSINERLEGYFYADEIQPGIIINNIDNAQTEISIGDHQIKWMATDKSTSIRIDDDLFSLDDKISLNHLEKGWSSEGDKVGFSNSWHQIKLFKTEDRQLIGISMSYQPCTGIGCGMTFFLIYDLKTKTKSFFGSFRITNELKLYDLKNDGTIDFVSGTYDAESDGVAKEIRKIYQVYSMDKSGNFSLQKDMKQKPYFMQRVFNAETYKEIERKFEQYWFEDIR